MILVARAAQGSAILVMKYCLHGRLQHPPGGRADLRPRKWYAQSNYKIEITCDYMI